ncbi:hypothetical protein [Kribbella swartbergensis]
MSNSRRIGILRAAPRRIVRATFRLLAAVRGARAFHPRGLAFRAELECVAPLPEGRYDAIARLTKGAGTPGDRPDVLGLAIRVRPADDDPWDLLLSSAGQGRLTRCLPIPARDWSNAAYGTIAPYEVGDRRFWLRATPQGPKVGHASVARLEADAPRAFTLAISGQTRGWHTVGRLTLSDALPDTSERFDPVRYRPPGWRLSPAWLRRVRELAYQGSRAGHRSTRSTAPS